MLVRASASEATDAILDAADRLLGRFGYRKMTIDDLAREAGIGKGTVYLSFDSKESIALACIDRMVDRLLGRLRTIAGGQGSAADRLEAMLVERVLHRFDYARQHSGSIDELLASLRPRFLARRVDHFRAEADLLASLLEQGVQRGEFSVADPRPTAQALVQATNALLPYSLSVEELGRRAQIERQARRIAGLLVRGLAVPIGSAEPQSSEPRSPNPPAEIRSSSRRRPS